MRFTLSKIKTDLRFYVFLFSAEVCLADCDCILVGAGHGRALAHIPAEGPDSFGEQLYIHSFGKRILIKGID